MRCLVIGKFYYEFKGYTMEDLQPMIRLYFANVSKEKDKPYYFKGEGKGKKVSYTIVRDESYCMGNGWIKDVDCAILTGLGVDFFQPGYFAPGEEPIVSCTQGSDGAYYSPIHEVEEFYGNLMTLSDCKTKVKIAVNDKAIIVTIKYPA